MARPEPGPGEVLARVRACGVCGSDLHAARFLDDMRAAGAAAGRRNWYENDLSRGFVMGHEFSAEVVATGPGVEGWAPGDRVTSMPVLIAPPPRSPFGYLSLGYSPQVNGAYAEYVVLSAPLLLRVPDNVSDEVAATTEPLAVGLHAVREARLRPGEPALVLGAGPVGLMTLACLKAEGAGLVAVSEPSPERRQLAGRMGADVVIDPAIEDLRERLDELFPAPAGGPIAGPGLVFECVGVPGTLALAMESVAVRGRVVVVGVCMQEDRLRPMVGINKQLTLQFVLGYSGEEYAEALRFHAEGVVDTSPLVTRTVGLDELPAAFAALADPRDCKVVVVP
jgi:threonine dehydrogenase-like Zn-dependent dehydrogenase